MQLEANLISRDWTVSHKGRTFYVNYTEADCQNLALCNRGNWEVWQETDNGTEELNEYRFKDDTPGQRKQAEQNARLKEKLVKFCIDNWDNQFMQEIKEQFLEQKDLL
jgi:hypothetical protein